MDRVKVLVTGSGAPGIKGTLYSIKNNWDDRKITTVGVDIREDAIGKYLCDQFYRVPAPESEAFIPEMLEICRKEGVDVVLPQVTRELSPLSMNKKGFEKIGTAVALSDNEPIRLANNKRELLQVAKEMNDLCPKFHAIGSRDELEEAAQKLGFPFVIKPPVSSGMRGFRIVYETVDRRREFFEEKPDSTAITIKELYDIFGESFPELLAMEYLPGPEYSVDILSDSDALCIVPRKRDQIRSGITFKGTVEKREDIIESSRRLARKLGLRYAHGLQYKEDGAGNPRLIESNPRIQGTMVLSTIAGANIIYGAVKLALGESVPAFSVRWGSKLLRYWGGVGINGSVVEL